MATTEDILNIDTPENVAFGYEVVGIGSRFIAGVVDSAILAAVIGTLALLVFWIFRVTGAEGGSLFVGIGIVMGFAILWGYYIFFEMTWNGRSPGKKAAGLRVIKRDGTPITLSESIIRNLIRTVDSLPAFYGVGIVTMFIDERSRRLGDIMAGTLVVRDNEDITLDSLTNTKQYTLDTRAPGKTESEVQMWPVHLLNDDDIRLAEDFLIRRVELNNSDKLGYTIARKLMKKMNVPATQAIFNSDTIYALQTIVREYHKSKA